VSGSDAVKAIRTLTIDLTEGFATRVDDILELRSGALLLRWTSSGIVRASGGAFERPLLSIQIFGADGLVARWEQFDADREAEALARFDEVSAEAPPTVRRRVRPNAGTAHADRLNAAIAARDAEAVHSLMSDGMHAVLHPTGAVLDRQETLDWWRLFFEEDRDGGFRLEPVATLGDSLALCRQSWTGTASAGPLLDVGAFQRDAFDVLEGGAQGRIERTEVFAPDRLGDAIVRLYERYAELLPEGPEKTRAAATARSVAVPMSQAPSADRHGAILTDDVEFVDHRTLVGLPSVRGADEIRQRIRSWFETVDDATIFIEEVVDLRPDGLLVRRRERGHDRFGGGSFEGQRLTLWLFGADGLLTRLELFDADRDAEALARFDELTAGPPPARLVQRRVRHNAATANAARLDLALAARDADALPMLYAEDAENLEHRTGASYGRSVLLDQYRKMLRTQDLSYRHEPLATLGDSLALCRLSVSGSGAVGRTFDVGAFEFEGASLVEVDAEGRSRRAEDFPADRLGDAIVRLYERYAELLPEGPERARAAGTARSVAAMHGGPFDADRYANALAPDVEIVDHRIFGTLSVRGSEAALENLRSFFAVADNYAARVDDILRLELGAVLSRGRTCGTDRVGGGAFERPLLSIQIFGADGRLTRIEVFDAERDVEALARFDELTAEQHTARPIPRRVRLNAATANAARIDAAITARDADALPSLLADECETVDHTLGHSFSRSGQLSSYRALMSARDPIHRSEPLATLGESLALSEVSISASSFSGGTFDVGAYQIERIALAEVDNRGRRRRDEVFALDRLGDAVVRLYERHAELLPEGPERARSAATARAVAAVQGFDLDRYGAALAPAVEFADHRALGFPRTTGAEAYMRRLASLDEVAADVANRIEDVLAIRADAFLVRWLNYGSDRAGGGAFERPFLILFVFGADGRVTHNELFDADREADALARFDALTAAPPATPFANAAWRAVEKSDAAMERRDWDAMVACYAPGSVLDDRRSLVRTFVSGEANLAHLRFLFDARRNSSRKLLATRGDRLALDRMALTSAARHGGLAEFEMLNVVEVDATGRRVAVVAFDPGDLDAAYAELDARYGATKVPTLLLRALAARDWDAVAALLASNLVIEDHRLLGWGTLHGTAAYITSLQALVDLAPDANLRLDHLEDSGRGALGITLLEGTREGGAFEDRRVVVVELDAQERIRRLDFYDLDHLDQARARFAELRPDPLRIPPNAASRASDLRHAAWQARDWDALRALASPDFSFEDRSKIARVSGDVEMWIENNRFVEPALVERELIGTAGDRVALERVLWKGEPDGAPVEREHLRLTEVDAEGRIRASIRFDPDDRAAAFLEAQARFAAGEAATIGGQAPIVALYRSITRHDWETVRGCLAEDAVMWDRRALGILGTLDRDPWVESLRAAADVAPDWNAEVVRILTWNGRGRVQLTRMFGTRDGGPFENLYAHVILTDGDRIARFEYFDVADADGALARFAELCADPT
jgi:ketosteroid isomerase-like protein